MNVMDEEDIIEFDNEEDEEVFTPKKVSFDEGNEDNGENCLEFDEGDAGEDSGKDSDTNNLSIRTHVATFCAVILLILVPVLIFMGIKGIKSGDNAGASSNTTEAITSFTTEIDESSVTGSTRFSTLSDLTYYIESFTNYYYSLELQLYTRYENEDLTRDEMVEIISGYTEEINTVYHLLTVNKSVYEENDMADTYSELNEEINELIIYGDMIIYSE